MKAHGINLCSDNTCFKSRDQSSGIVYNSVSPERSVLHNIFAISGSVLSSAGIYCVV